MVGKDGEEAAKATIDSTLPNPRLTSGRSTWKWTSVLKKIFSEKWNSEFLVAAYSAVRVVAFAIERDPT
jgi:hypothetical protein